MSMPRQTFQSHRWILPIAILTFVGFLGAPTVFAREYTTATCAFFADPARSTATQIQRAASIDAAYLAYWGREARCDELQFHLERGTSMTKLRRWLNARAEAWYENLTEGPLNGQTLSTSTHEWFFVSGGQIHRIPDWPTALAWGLLLEDRWTIPAGMTASFYRRADLGTPLNFSDGPFASSIHGYWKQKRALPSNLPARLRTEIDSLVDAPGFENVFFLTSYTARTTNDAHAKLLNWDWMRGNPANFRIAFFGDQGFTSNAERVLNLVRDEKADMAIHLGDFDYLDDADAWDQLITDALGADFPYFGTVGNHDVAAWPNYQQKLEERLARIPDARCSGDLGVNATCRYRNISFVLSGVGTEGSGHEDFLEQSLAAFPSSWKLCLWHKNQRAMQVGGKGDEVGWRAYQVCREAGAMIATAHEHSYSRTHLMSSFTAQTIASTSSTLALGPGRSFVVVSGLGGHSVREQDDGLAANPWWAAIDTATQNATYGALFCDMNLNGDPSRASCYFKNIRGVVRDRFELTRPL